MSNDCPLRRGGINPGVDAGGQRIAGAIMKEPLRADLRRAGRRITPQRLLILDVMRRGGGHLDADEIYRRAKTKAPTLSLSTVYRTIGVLKDAGLIEELHLDEEHHHYELKDEAGHHHLICQGCGRIIEFDCPFSQAFLCDLGEQYDFQISAVQLNLTGYCSDCRASAGPSTPGGH